MTARLLPVIGLSLLCGGQGFAQGVHDTLPGLENYAWGFALDTSERASFYHVELPVTVYRSVADARLRDLSVYNGEGQAVPRVIEPAAATTGAQETRHTLPFAALYLDQEPDADRVRMMFEQMGGETRIKVESDAPASGGKMRAPLTGYIVDTRALSGNVDALELAWPRPQTGFVGRVTVSGSNDFGNWRMLGGAALADLEEDATLIKQNRIALTDDDYDFLRLNWSSLPDDWRLTELTAIQVTAAPRYERRELELETVGRDADDSGLLFDSPGPLPVDQLGLQLHDNNAVVSVSIYQQSFDSDTWQRLHDGAFYKLLRDGLPVTSQPAVLEPTRAARWKVVIRKGNPDTPFQLVLGWRPDTLLFVAQGDAPFTLATGRAQARDEGFPEDRLLGDLSLGGIATDNGPVAAATVKERRALAGIERQAEKKPVDWRTVLLWLGLSVAVLFVVSMAIRVTRALSDDNLD